MKIIIINNLFPKQSTFKQVENVDMKSLDHIHVASSLLIFYTLLYIHSTIVSLEIIEDDKNILCSHISKKSAPALWYVDVQTS